MEEMKFNSLNELYTRLYPAFNTKKEELSKENISVREIDMWNYLKDSKWSKSSKLNMYDMVNDIFSINIFDCLEYIKNN